MTIGEVVRTLRVSAGLKQSDLAVRAGVSTSSISLVEAGRDLARLEALRVTGRALSEGLEEFLREQAPDVLCLQEIKCSDREFPVAAFKRAGYAHIAINGQKGYHGVAIASRPRR